MARAEQGWPGLPKARTTLRCLTPVTEAQTFKSLSISLKSSAGSCMGSGAHTGACMDASVASGSLTSYAARPIPDDIFL